LLWRVSADEDLATAVPHGILEARMSLCDWPTHAPNLLIAEFAGRQRLHEAI
jgi:hypothetical protein